MKRKKDNQLRKIQLIQLEILKEFIRICNVLNLRYFGLGGTALGAVRHNGIIPWDDDIDVGMPREDYEIFIEKSPKILKDKYFVQCNKTDNEYFNNFAKLRNSQTTFIEKTVSHLNINHGVYIDIFPLDGLPKNKLLSFTYYYYLKFLNGFKSASFYREKSRSLVRDLIDKIMFLGTFIYGVKRISFLVDKILKKYPYKNSDNVMNFSGAWGRKEIFSKVVFGKGFECIFEDIRVRIPEKYDTYLTKMYGEYNKFPPKEKQQAHHDFYFYNLGKGYKNYTLKLRNKKVNF